MKRRFIKATVDRDATRGRAAKQRALLRRAVDDWPQFDGAEPVNGGDLVEWFALFRADAKQMLGRPRQRNKLEATTIVTHARRQRLQ
jgi:hypothetical protein